MRRDHDERGEAVTQTVIIAPALFLLIMFILQLALVAHAQNVAEAAAQEGSAASRQFGASESDGVAKTDTALGSLGPKMLTDRHVTVNRTATTVTVTVTGHAISLIPGFNPKVKETASGPVERYVAPEDPS